MISRQIWAKMNGYNTSTYLGKPIVKFTKLYIRIERRDGSLQSSGLSNVRKSWRWQMDQERLDWAIKNISRQNTLQVVWTSKTRKRQAKLSALSRVIHKTINSDMATQTIPEFFLGNTQCFFGNKPWFSGNKRCFLGCKKSVWETIALASITPFVCLVFIDTTFNEVCRRLLSCLPDKFSPLLYYLAFPIFSTWYFHWAD